MIKLLGESLAHGVRFSPETQKLDITERGSTSSFSLPISSGVELDTGDWVLDDTEPGAGIVWRVKSADLTYNTDTRLIQLEHVINTLRDRSVFGEVKAKTISGTDTCTARQAFEYFLARQDVWQLGDFEYNVAQPFSFNGETIFDALTTVSSALDNPIWEYDLTSLPFTLHVRHKPTAASCEMRFGRNLSTLRRTEDRTKMYTRIYPIGKKNLHITGEYISRNEEIFGRVDKVMTDQSQETEAALRAWAQDKLNRHSEPIVNISISGLDFSRATGENLDRLVINKVCRVPLPKYGTTILEPIVHLSWKDKISKPEDVQVTLCNAIEDVASFAKEQAASGGRGGRADAKEKQEDHAWFVDTESHVAMVAEAIIGRDPGASVDWSRVAEIIVDGSGIHQAVVQAQGSLVEMDGRIDMNEESLTTAFTRIGGLDGSMVMTAESLTTVFTKTGISSLGQNETLYSKIAQEAGRIDLVVSGSGTSASIRIQSIVDGINQSAVQIDAAKIYLNGDVIANAISAVSLELQSLMAGTAKATLINTDALTTTSGGTVSAGTLYGASLSVGSGDSGGSGTLYYRGNQYYRQGLTLGPVGSLIAEAHFLGDSSTAVSLNHSHAITMTEITSGQHAGEVQATIGAAVPESDASATSFFDITATQTYNTGVAASKNTVKVTGPTWSTTPGASVSGNSNTATFTTDADAPSGTTPKSLALYLSRADSWDTINNTRTVYLTHTDSTAANRVAKIDVAGPTVTAVTASGNAPVLYQGNWIDNMSVTLSNGYTQTNVRTDVSAIYQAGASAASVDSIVFSAVDQGDPSSDKNDKPITATAKSGTTVLYSDDQIIHMTQGNWSGGRKAVNVRLGSSSGVLVTRLWIDAPSSSVGTPYINNVQAGYIRAVVSVNGTTYYGNSIKLTSAQISSWGGPIS